MQTKEVQAAPPRSHEEEARRRALQALSEFETAALGGHPPTHLKLELAQAALMFRNALWHHRNEPTAKSLWEELDMTAIQERLGRSIEVEQPAPGDTPATVTVQQPAIYECPWDDLTRPIRRLDDVFKALGLGQDTAEGDRPTGVIGSVE